MQSVSSFTLSHIYLIVSPFANYELLVTSHFVVECCSFRKLPTSFGLLWAGVRSLASTQVLDLYQFKVLANFPFTCSFLKRNKLSCSQVRLVIFTRVHTLKMHVDRLPG